MPHPAEHFLSLAARGSSANLTTILLNRRITNRDFRARSCTQGTIEGLATPTRVPATDRGRETTGPRGFKLTNLARVERPREHPSGPRAHHVATPDNMPASCARCSSRSRSSSRSTRSRQSSRQPLLRGQAHWGDLFLPISLTPAAADVSAGRVRELS